jgi:hypothetical protein
VIKIKNKREAVKKGQQFSVRAMISLKFLTKPSKMEICVVVVVVCETFSGRLVDTGHVHGAPEPIATHTHTMVSKLYVTITNE